MQTATSETESKSLDLSICVHHYTLRAPCPKGQGNPALQLVQKIPNRPLRGRRGRFGTLWQLLECRVFGRTAVQLQRGPWQMSATLMDSSSAWYSSRCWARVSWTWRMLTPSGHLVGPSKRRLLRRRLGLDIGVSASPREGEKLRDVVSFD